jgi:hypothetical protein
MLYLLFHPGTDHEERIPFSVSEANIDDALDYGRAERGMSFNQQMDATAYHMVLDLNVCRDAERISSEPWVIVRDGRIVGRNHLAMSVREDDLYH